MRSSNGDSGGIKIKKFLFLIVLLIALAGAYFYYVYGPEETLASVKSGIEDVVRYTPDLKQNPVSSALAELKAEEESAHEVPESEIGDKYIYNQLTENQKTAYRRLYAAMLALEPSALIPPDTYSDLGEFEVIDIYNAVLSDYPEIFWADNGITIQTKSMGGLNFGSVEIKLKYIYEETEIAQIKEKVSAYVTECFANLPGDGTTFDKILYVHDYVINHIEYNKAYESSQNIVSAMLEGQAVCAGYAKTMQYLLNQLDIPCITVGGYGKNEPHAWNLISADGIYYYLDATWDDTSQDGSDGVFKYDYFLLTSKDIERTHVANVKYTLPVCNADMLNYYVYTGRMFDTYDYDGILAVVKGDALNGKHQTAFRLSSHSAFETAKIKLFEDNELFKLLEDAGAAAQGSVSYVLNSDLDIFRITLS